MPRSHPDILAILDAANAYFEGELLATLSGYHRFQCRVAINALNIVRRQLSDGPAMDAAEYQRLLDLVGVRGHPEDGNAPMAWLDSQLALQIRNGRRNIDDPALRAHIRQTLHDALAINNPKWLAR